MQSCDNTYKKETQIFGQERDQKTVRPFDGDTG